MRELPAQFFVRAVRTHEHDRAVAAEELEKALEMVNRNQITDSLSIAGLLKAWSLKQRGLLENPPSEEQIPWK